MTINFGVVIFLFTLNYGEIYGTYVPPNIPNFTSVTPESNDNQNGISTQRISIYNCCSRRSTVLPSLDSQLQQAPNERHGLDINPSIAKTPLNHIFVKLIAYNFVNLFAYIVNLAITLSNYEVPRRRTLIFNIGNAMSCSQGFFSACVFFWSHEEVRKKYFNLVVNFPWEVNRLLSIHRTSNESILKIRVFFRKFTH